MSITWSSTASTDWGVDANWSGGVKPSSSDDVVFDATSVISCTLSANAAAASVTMDAAYSGTLNIGVYDLAVTGNVSLARKVTMGISAGAGLTCVNFTMAAGGVWTGTGAGKVTISGNWTQSSVTSKFLASTATITLTGAAASFTADGTLDSTQYNAASLVLNGTNTLGYAHLTTPTINGFNNLTGGQGGFTTTISSTIGIINQLVIGSGAVNAGNYYLYFKGSTPLSVDTANSRLYANSVQFYSAVSATIPSLTQGYDTSIYSSNTTLTQTGDIILNTTKFLYVQLTVSSINTWKTDGYNLTVGGVLAIGFGADTGLKKLVATRNGARTSTITVGGNWLNYGTGSAPSQFVADNSTVILTGTGSVTSGAKNSPFWNLVQNGGVIYYNTVRVTGTLDPDVVETFTNDTAGYPNGYNSFPVYKRVGLVGGYQYYIWYRTTGTPSWLISNIPGGGGQPYYWLNGIATIPSTYVAQGGASGIATVANVTGSGICAILGDAVKTTTWLDECRCLNQFSHPAGAQVNPGFIRSFPYNANLCMPLIRPRMIGV